eukprot:TRINITY_DN5421_c0_g1_i1.p1 TRINITY_DN5421_c0_g1~~TRINITY_DN5421_c0_g1_i1.p1  ORF type:complete len:113 (+),score=11.63 TRINITY_DN5421_c0_g1_i1:92-430(+)
MTLNRRTLHRVDRNARHRCAGNGRLHLLDQLRIGNGGRRTVDGVMHMTAVHIFIIADVTHMPCGSGRHRRAARDDGRGRRPYANKGRPFGLGRPSPSPATLEAASEFAIRAT